MRNFATPEAAGRNQEAVPSISQINASSRIKRLTSSFREIHQTPHPTPETTRSHSMIENKFAPQHAAYKLKIAQTVAPNPPANQSLQNPTEPMRIPCNHVNSYFDPQARPAIQGGSSPPGKRRQCRETKPNVQSSPAADE